MGRRCSTCSHPDRQIIEQALLEGRLSQRVIAQEYSVNRASIANHFQKHIPTIVAQASPDAQESIGDKLETLTHTALDLIDARLHDPESRDQLGTINALRAYLSTFIDMVSKRDERKQDAGDTALKRYMELHPQARAAYLAWYRRETRGRVIAATTQVRLGPAVTAPQAAQPGGNGAPGANGGPGAS